MAVKKVVWHTGTSATIPSDFVSLVSVEALGAGGNGQSRTAGSGAAYAITTAVAGGLTRNQIVNAQFGQAGGSQGTSSSPGVADTWFKAAATVLYVQGGQSGGGSAGLAANCFPTSGAFSGGSGAVGGGGGAAGPHGAGANGVTSGAGGAGDAGHGGAGGSAGSGAGAAGHSGGTGSEWTDFNSIVWGSGGGGGPGATGATGSGVLGSPGGKGGNGANGGSYGAGGGGGGLGGSDNGSGAGPGSPGTPGAGTGGIIVFTYNASAPIGNSCFIFG